MMGPLSYKTFATEDSDKIYNIESNCFIVLYGHDMYIGPCEQIK